MSATYHTPLGANASLDSLAFNTIFGALDLAIVDLDTRIDTLESVRIGADGVTLLNLDDQSTKTLVNNAFTRSSSWHIIDTEGAAASDYLDTISGGNAGDILILELASDARPITIRHNQDNILTTQGTNYTLKANIPIIGKYNGSYWSYITEAAGGIAVLQHQEAQNTGGGTATAGAWETRDINTKSSDVFNIASIHKLAFTSGGTYEIIANDTIEGATSGESATIFDVEVTSGSWAGADAAGNLWIHSASGAFVAENLNVGVELNVATVGADATTGEIRLKTGIYRIHGWASAYEVNAHQTRLYDTTNSNVLILGSTERSAAGDISATASRLEGRFSLTDAATLELQHQVTATKATVGYGTAGNFTTEVYASLTIEQEI